MTTSHSTLLTAHHKSIYVELHINRRFGQECQRLMRGEGAYRADDQACLILAAVRLGRATRSSMTIKIVFSPPLPPSLESDHKLLERVEHADDALVSGVAEWARAAPTAAR